MAAKKELTEPIAWGPSRDYDEAFPRVRADLSEPDMEELVVEVSATVDSDAIWLNLEGARILHEALGKAIAALT